MSDLTRHLSFVITGTASTLPMPSFLFSICLLLTSSSLLASASKAECQKFTREGEAKSVWSLKPSQVDIVMATGDSITAAFGANGRKGGLHEYRGISWSIGGDSNATTLPNYLRHYSQDIKGFSVGRREGSLCWGPICRDIHRARHDVFNAALSGAMIRNVVYDELGMYLIFLVMIYIPSFCP